MEQTKHYSKLKNGMVNYIAPPNIQIMLSGVKWASQDKTGLVTLCYTDDTKETKALKKDICLEMESFFNVISAVQDR